MELIFVLGPRVAFPIQLKKLKMYYPSCMNPLKAAIISSMHGQKVMITMQQKMLNQYFRLYGRNMHKKVMKMIDEIPSHLCVSLMHGQKRAEKYLEQQGDQKNCLA
eukprot:2196277-Ditylum_brightwellii.AAC.1